MNAAEPKESFLQGERATAKICTKWKGNSELAAVTAATEIGRLTGKIVGYERAKMAVQRGFDVRRVDEKHWQAVFGAFQNGRGSLSTNAELREEYFPAANDNLIEPTVFEWEDPSKLPVRDWLYGKHLIRRHVSATIASGAVGKTSLKIVEALALVTGRALLGQAVPKRLNVWLFNLEDDMIELRRRVSAAMIHYNIKPAEIGDRLHIDGEKSLVITKTTRRCCDAVAMAVQCVIHRRRHGRPA
jgi:RecA-family ATPase